MHCHNMKKAEVSYDCQMKIGGSATGSKKLLAALMFDHKGDIDHRSQNVSDQSTKREADLNMQINCLEKE